LTIEIVDWRLDRRLGLTIASLRFTGVRTIDNDNRQLQAPIVNPNRHSNNPHHQSAIKKSAVANRQSAIDER
jgi:hypothetical protein